MENHFHNQVNQSAPMDASFSIPENHFSFPLLEEDMLYPSQTTPMDLAAAPFFAGQPAPAPTQFHPYTPTNNQMSFMPIPSFGDPMNNAASTNTFIKHPMRDLRGHNWEGILSYLAGQVRPGPDVPLIYKCNVCSLEFPTAQAFGGHMSSHSRNKKNKNSGGGEGKAKKASQKAGGSKNKKKVDEMVWEDEEYDSGGSVNS